MTRSWRRTVVRSCSLVVASLVGLLSARSASAQEANGFGEKTQLIITADRLMPLFSYSSQTVTETRNGATLRTSDSGTSAAFLLGSEPSLGSVHTIPRVALDFTVVHHLTLGGSIVLAFGLGGTHEDDFGNNTTRKGDAPKTTVIGIAPRVGYVIPLASTFAFWPRAGFAFYSVSTKTSNFQGNNNIEIVTTNNDSLLSLDLDPQFVWAPIPHFFFHFGPLVNVPLSGSRSVETATGATSNTTKSDLSVFHFGISAGLGGWFDL
jgi:hypothetical protein